MIRNVFAASLALGAIAGTAMAHSGHGGEPGQHWFTHVDHAIVVVLAATAAGLATYGIARALWRLCHG